MPEIEKVLNMCEYTLEHCLNMPEYSRHRICKFQFTESQIM